jgi:hypothetical protein
VRYISPVMLMQEEDVDDGVEVGSPLQLLVLDDHEVVGQVDVVAALEEALVLAPFGVGVAA